MTRRNRGKEAATLTAEQIDKVLNALALLGPRFAASDHTTVVDVLLRLQLLTVADLRQWFELDNIEASAKREPRSAYLLLMRYDQGRELVQRCRPALWARIVATGGKPQSRRHRSVAHSARRVG